MKFRDTLIILLCIVFSGLLFALGYSRLEPIGRARREMNLVCTEIDNVPPSLAYATVAMGAFRGLVVDVLWLRADKLKEQGLFFDAKQLADWITVLQPRFATVWDFQAWNMAYNISVAIPAVQWEERWRWVRNGYELLRDKGIPKNPNNIALYRSLAWIFLHKIGDISDDCHRHYKRELALSMRQMLGNPETNEQFEKLIAAPQTFRELFEQQDIAEFVNLLRQADSAFADDKTIAKNYLSLIQNPRKFSPAALEVLARYRGTDTRDKFETFAKAWQLQNEWKLDIEFMHRLNKKFGPHDVDDPNIAMPLNWEHPAAHAIYWAQLGLEKAGRPGEYNIDEKNTDRIVFHGLQLLYRTGKLILYDVEGQLPSVFLDYDLRMFDSCNSYWIQTTDKYESFEKGNPKELYQGRRTFLVNSVALFYESGHTAKAAKIYLELRRDYPEGTNEYDFNDPLELFVRKRYAEELKDISDKDAMEHIIASLRSAFLQYALHEDETAFAKEKWAKEIYDIYSKDVASESYRMGLPAFDMLKYIAFTRFVYDGALPEQMRARLMARIQVERPELFEQLIRQDIELQKQLQNLSQQPQAPASP